MEDVSATEAPVTPEYATGILNIGPCPLRKQGHSALHGIEIGSTIDTDLGIGHDVLFNENQESSR